MKKRAVSLFMALIMAFTMAAGTVSPAAAEEAGSYTASLASDAYNVSVNGTIQILFSKAMDDESASEPITLTNSERKSEVCSCTWNDEGTCLNITLEGLEPFTEYTLALNKDLRAADGSGAKEDYSWTLLTAAAETVAQEHLVMHWEMDETSGATVYDTGTSGTNGTYLYNNKAADAVDPVENGQFNGALHFDKGTAVRSEVSPVTEYPFTQSVWFNPTDTKDNGVLTYMGPGNGITDQRFSMIVRENMMTLRNASGTGDISGTIDFIQKQEDKTWTSDGKWHLATGVFTEDTMTLYVDGEKIATGSHTATTETVKWVSLGCHDRNTTTDNFKGALDDFRLYDVALTEEQVAELYAEELPAFSSSDFSARLNPGQGDLGVSAPIALCFSMPLDPATVEGNVTVTDEANAVVPFTWKLTDLGTVLYLEPASTLIAGKTYTVAVTEGLFAKDGTPAGGNSQEFQPIATAGEPPVANYTLSEPWEDGENVALTNSTVEVSFDTKMQSETLSADNITVETAAGEPVAVKVTPNANATGVTLAPASASQEWAPDTEYTVVISEAVKDGNNQSVSTDTRRFTFQTVPEETMVPTVTVSLVDSSKNPIEDWNRENIPADAWFAVHFSQPMESANVLLLGTNGRDWKFGWEWDNTKTTYYVKPDPKLVPGWEYDVYVNQGTAQNGRVLSDETRLTAHHFSVDTGVQNVALFQTAEASSSQAEYPAEAVTDSYPEFTQWKSEKAVEETTAELTIDLGADYSLDTVRLSAMEEGTQNIAVLTAGETGDFAEAAAAKDYPFTKAQNTQYAAETVDVDVESARYVKLVFALEPGQCANLSEVEVNPKNDAPDLVVTSSGDADVDNPQAGDSITLTVEIKNTNPQNAVLAEQPITVQWVDRESGSVLAEATHTGGLDPLERAVVTAGWTVEEGITEFDVVVNPEGTVKELNYSNNQRFGFKATQSVEESFEGRSQLLINSIVAYGYEGATGRKQGGQAAMAFFEKGDVPSGVRYAYESLKNSATEMFDMYAAVLCYAHYKEYYPQWLLDFFKEKMDTQYVNMAGSDMSDITGGWSGSTENHTLMISSSVYIVGQDFPDIWSKWKDPETGKNLMFEKAKAYLEYRSESLVKESVWRVSIRRKPPIFGARALRMG